MAKAIIAMSGGVDSSVAALLTQQAGHTISGVTLKLHDERSGVCGSADDAAEAAAICQQLSVPHEIWDGRQEFRRCVMDHFVDSYSRGGTPNPCIECNRCLKFGFLLNRALEQGADFVVSGHYARVQQDPATGRWLLKKALCDQKDQSYVLYTLSQAQLAHLRLPLGGRDKDSVRAQAADSGFKNSQKPDSQDICFVPDGAYAQFIWKYTGKQPQPGDFIDEDGCIMGQHGGIECYTIGQRRGIGISGRHPYYVVAKDAGRNTVMLGDEDLLFRDELMAGNLNWIAFESLREPVRCAARTRYHQTETPCTVYPQGDRVRVKFDSSIRAITPGQAVVFYQDDLVLGGGTIL